MKVCKYLRHACCRELLFGGKQYTAGKGNGHRRVNRKAQSLVGETERYSVIKYRRMFVRVSGRKCVKPGGTAGKVYPLLSQHACMGQDFFVLVTV